MTPPNRFCYMISTDIDKKLKKCLRNSNYSWIYDDIYNNLPLVEIAQKYLDLYEKKSRELVLIKTESETEFETETLDIPKYSCIFSAYLLFKKGTRICKNNANYIVTHREILASNFDDVFQTYDDICVGDLIYYLDGNDFFDWVDSIADYSTA